MRKHAAWILSQLLPAVAFCLRSVVSPCGDAKLPFEEEVRRNLVRAGYLNSYDVVHPIEMKVHAGGRGGDPFRQPPSGCWCDKRLDPVASSFDAGA